MNGFSTSPLEIAAVIAMTIFSLAIFLCLIRLARGPSLSDRIVAMDVIGTLFVGLFVVYGIAESQPHALRVATVLALVNFIGTVGFATFIYRSACR